MANKRSNPEFRKQVYDKCNGKCAYCGHPILITMFEIDHVKPLMRHVLDRSQKGENALHNYLPACGSCNSSKSSMTLEVWRGEISKKLDRLKRDSSTYRLCLRFKMIKEKPSPVIFYFEKTEVLNG